jgi:malate dehydrogenase (oxaloacetate-decarboxylating)(NADP+)
LPNANLTGRANILVMPNMDSAAIALGLMRTMTNSRLIGPYLAGLPQNAHVLIPSVSARGIFNMTALCSADAAK